MRFWSRFRDWRRSRPFWGGLFTLLAGAEIVYLPLSPLNEIIAAGVAGVQSVLVGFLILVMGAFVWFSPSNRLLAGVLTIIFSVSSLVLSNLGGLVVGMLVGITGGALTIAWTDRPRRRHDPQPAAGEPPPEESDAGVSIVEPRPEGNRPEGDRRELRLPDVRWRPGVVAALAGLLVVWPSPVEALASPADAGVAGVGTGAGAEPGADVRSVAGTGTGAGQPTPDCLAALAALPRELLNEALPALEQLLPGLGRLVPRLQRLLPVLPLFAPPPPPPTDAQVLAARQEAARACALPQLVPPAGGLPDPLAPLLPSVPPLPGGSGVRLPDLSRLPRVQLPGLPRLPGAPLPPGLPPELRLPNLPLPPLPLPNVPLPNVPLPQLPIPQVPVVPFPPLPGLPGLPGVDPPPGPDDLPLPVEPAPDAGQRVFAGTDVTPTVTSRLTMATLDATAFVYEGIVELPTAAGGTVRALRFSIGTIDADDLKIGVPTHTGDNVDLAHTPGNHVLGSDVTLDCTRLSLNALGVLPVTFTLDSPPPSLLTIPLLSGTDVDIDLVTLKLAQLTVPTAEASLRSTTLDTSLSST